MHALDGNRKPVNEEEKKRVKEEEEIFEKFMSEMNLDGDESVSKQEFCNAYVKKHSQLENEWLLIQEDLKDLVSERMIIEERSWKFKQGLDKRPYNPKNAVLKVIVVEARGIEGSDMLTGRSDPYLEIFHGNQMIKTTIIYSTLNAQGVNPLWREGFEFTFLGPNQKLQVFLFDYDALTIDDLIGRLEIDLTGFKNNKIYDNWYEFVDEKGKKARGKVRLIIQLLMHGPPDFDKEMERVKKKMEKKEIELKATSDKIRLMEKSFDFFDIEERNRKMQEELGGKVNASRAERKCSDFFHRITKGSPWVTILLLFIIVYTFFTFCICFLRPAFWDVMNCCVGFFLYVFVRRRTPELYRQYFKSIVGSIIYDLIFLAISAHVWWIDQKWDGQIEQGLRQFVIVMTCVIIVLKVILAIMFWHTSVNFADLIAAPQMERGYGADYMSQHQPNYGGGYGSYSMYGGYGNYGRPGGYGGYGGYPYGGYMGQPYSGYGAYPNAGYGYGGGFPAGRHGLHAGNLAPIDAYKLQGSDSKGGKVNLQREKGPVASDAYSGDDSF